MADYGIRMKLPTFQKLRTPRPRKDEIASFMEDEKKTLLEALYLACISKPRIASSLKYRFMTPDFFNYTISEFYSQEVLKITEHEGKAHDWELMGKKISVKSVQNEIFPRETRNGNGVTAARPIQLKNTKESTSIKEGEFDYLIVTVSVEKDSIFGMYLFSFDSVVKMLEKSHKFNSKCDRNGFDGKGQIKLYPSREECICAMEIDEKMLEDLHEKFCDDISPGRRNSRWLTGMNGLVRAQISLSRDDS